MTLSRGYAREKCRAKSPQKKCFTTWRVMGADLETVGDLKLIYVTLRKHADQKL